MNLPRICELQDFSDSFNLKISQAIERYDNHINELNRPVKTVPSCFSAPKKIKISKKKYVSLHNITNSLMISSKNHLLGKTRNIMVDTSISLNFSKQNMNQLP